VTLAAAPALAQPSFLIVAHPTVPGTAYAKEDLSRVFLKKVATWKDGAPAVPVDQSPSSPIRAEFSETVHGRPVSAVESYWQNIIFTGRGSPPAEEASDEAVLRVVRATPGAVGYISAATRPDGVKVIALEGSASEGLTFQDADLIRRRRFDGREPGYPAAALRNEEEGVVVAKIVISPAGRVSRISFVQTHPAFEQAVREAVSAWRFAPLVVAGAPVASYSIIRFTFKMQR
jgi:TonB family protein